MNMWKEWLSRLRDPRGQRPDTGWARRSLEAAVSRVLLIAIATIHGLMVLAAIFSLGLNSSGCAVAASHLLAIVVALTVLRFGRGYLLLIVYSWALFVVGWATTPTPESTLLFAACWLRNLTDAAPAFLLRARSSLWVSLGAAVVMPSAMVIARPEWADNPLVPAVAVTVTAITLATRIGLSYLLDYTDRVDAEARELESRTAALTVRKAATHQAAEDARVLHDTAINTLGAIANGGAAIDDLDAVRQRCRADIAAIDALRSTKGDDLASRHGFREAIRPAGIRVRYAGMSDEEIAHMETLLPMRVVRALGRAAGEAVQNAAKHSGADEVVVSIERTAEGLRVAIRDQGVGTQTDWRRGGGVEQSILERARDSGIQAAIESTPGQGTTVTLEYALDDAPLDEPARSNLAEPDRAAVATTVEDLVRQLRSRAVFALSAGLVGVGVTLSALNHPGEATPEWLMSAVVALACWLAWRERNRPRVSAWTAGALMTAGPLAFVLSAWSVGFGRIDPYLWQAIAPTGPLIALVIGSPSRTLKIMGFTTYVLTVALTAASVAPLSLEAAFITGVAGLVGFGLVLSVASFVSSLSDVTTRAHREQRAAFAVGLALSSMEAAGEARRRWRDAGLEQAVALLRAIGDGRADPRDPAIRQRCAEEEAFLRQLSLLNPELIQMGTWFARALNAARLRGVHLTVRAGATDANADEAQQLGGTLLTVVDALPPGTRLTTALFSTLRGLTMTLVAPTPRLHEALNGDGRQSRRLQLQILGEQDLAELVVAGSGS